MKKLSLRSSPQYLICADEEDYLSAILWEEDLQERGYDFQLSLKGTVRYDGKDLAILSYLQLYNRDRKAQYLQELKKLINITIFQKIKNSSLIIFIISSRTLSPFLFVQIIYSILMNIPFMFTHKLNSNDQFYEIIDSLMSAPISICTLESFPPLSNVIMGENYEM